MSDRAKEMGHDGKSSSVEKSSEASLAVLLSEAATSEECRDSSRLEENYRRW